MKPLAYLMRPHHFDDIVGQDHLVGENGIIRKMINTNHYFPLFYMVIQVVVKQPLHLLLVKCLRLQPSNSMLLLIIKIF